MDELKELEKEIIDKNSKELNEAVQKHKSVKEEIYLDTLMLAVIFNRIGRIEAKLIYLIENQSEIIERQFEMQASLRNIEERIKSDG